MDKNTNESVVAGLKVGMVIRQIVNGRTFSAGKIIRLGDTFPAKAGGLARTVEWESPTGNGSYSTCYGDRDVGKFFEVVG